MTTRRTTALTIGFAALLLSVTGCATVPGQGAPGAAPTDASTARATPTPTVAASPTRTSTSTPTAASTATASGPSTWRFGPSSFGPVTLGAADADTVLPPAGFTRQAPSGCATLWDWTSTDLTMPDSSGYRVQIGADDSGPGVRYVRVAGQAAAPDQFSSPALTTNGIALGSTADAVKSAYPDLVKTVDMWEAQAGGHREYVTPTADGHWLHFDTTGGDATHDVVSAVVVNDTKGSTQAVCP
jgi:hypothetical protein